MLLTRLALSLRDEPQIRSRTVSTWRAVSGTQRSAEHVSTPFAAPMDNRRLAGLTDNVRVATSASGTNVRCSGGHAREWMFESHISNSSKSHACQWQFKSLDVRHEHSSARAISRHWRREPSGSRTHRIGNRRLQCSLSGERLTMDPQRSQRR